jgi:hypothetical protein
MRKASDKELEKLSAEIASLQSLDLSQLKARWKLLYETASPPHRAGTCSGERLLTVCRRRCWVASNRLRAAF